jgi:DNA transposition AAA+ family ATPase
MSVLLPNGFWPAPIEFVRDELAKLIASRKERGRPLSMRAIEKSIGRSASMVSDFLNHKARGDVLEFVERLKQFLEVEHARESNKLLNIPFCETQQAQALMQAVEVAHRWQRMAAVLLPSGCGKTRTIHELQRRDRTLLVVRTNVMMGPHGLLRAICEESMEPSSGLGSACYKRALAKLRDSGRCLIIDDAHDLSLKALHVVRSFQEDSGIGLVLCGITTLKRYLTGYTDELEQLASRLEGRIWTPPSFGEDDILLLLKACMDEDQVDTALEVLRQDPRAMTNARRLVSALEIAHKSAEKKKSKVTVEFLRRALKDAA